MKCFLIPEERNFIKNEKIRCSFDMTMYQMNKSMAVLSVYTSRLSDFTSVLSQSAYSYMTKTFVILVITKLASNILMSVR